jgi:hypothetical protein
MEKGIVCQADRGITEGTEARIMEAVAAMITSSNNILTTAHRINIQLLLQGRWIRRRIWQELEAEVRRIHRGFPRGCLAEVCLGRRERQPRAAAWGMSVMQGGVQVTKGREEVVNRPLLRPHPICRDRILAAGHHIQVLRPRASRQICRQDLADIAYATSQLTMRDNHHTIHRRPTTISFLNNRPIRIPGSSINRVLPYRRQIRHINRPPTILINKHRLWVP